MGFKKSCGYEEFWGAKVKHCDYEFDPVDGEVFEFLAKKIENYELDEIPNEIEIETFNCLDPECERIEEAVFVINPFDYLTSEEIDDLEKLLAIMYPEEEDEEE